MAWNSIASANGDLWNVWTDHLRHAGEALALVERGLKIYDETYGQATADVALPCAEHQGLWAASGIPYPPLGILSHWPVAVLERNGVLAPATAHRLQVWLLGLVGVLCVVLSAQALAGRRRWAFLLLTAPLILGTGFSGFFDTLFLLSALAALRWGSPGLAVLSWCLHFRGIVALGFRSWRQQWPWLIPAVMNAAIAMVAFQHLGEFHVSSPLHFSQLTSLWFPGSVALVWWLLRGEPTRVGFLLTALAIYGDRQNAFWHLLVLVPLLFATYQRGSTRAVLVTTGWCVLVAQVFLRSWVPFQFIWLTVRG